MLVEVVMDDGECGRSCVWVEMGVGGGGCGQRWVWEEVQISGLMFVY